MNWADVKHAVEKSAPFLAAGLDATGPLGALAGGIISAALGTASNPDDVNAALLRDPAALERVRLAEINNSAALSQAMIENANLQAKTNMVSAAHPWLIGWRSIVGYDCAIALTLLWVVFPLVEFVSGFWHVSVPVPVLDTGTLLKILSALLGLATWHGVENWRSNQ